MLPTRELTGQRYTGPRQHDFATPTSSLETPCDTRAKRPLLPPTDTVVNENASKRGSRQAFVKTPMLCPPSGTLAQTRDVQQMESRVEL